jgi:membrane fusion protein (multidrug efflux system)
VAAGPLLVVAALLAGCQDPVATASQTRESDPQRQESTVVTERTQAARVETTVLEPAPFVETLEVTGTIAARGDVVISSELGGLVREVSFDEGDRLSVGAVLARVGDDLAEARLEQAQAELVAATANHEQVSQLFERQAVPRDRLITATADLDRARAVVRERELILDRAVIRTPIDGIATSREVEPGEVIAPGTRITTVTDTTRLEIETSVPDTEIEWLSVGRAAKVAVDAFPGHAFSARVSFVSPVASRDNRSFPIKLTLDDDGRRLRPGMVVRARMDKRRVKDGLVVPLDALVTRTDGVLAFVVEDCVARVRPVVISASEGERAMISSGLQQGDRLVVVGQADLSDGQRVVSENCP